MHNDRPQAGWIYFRIIFSFIVLFSLLSCTEQEKESLKVGDTAPDFSAPGLDGKVFSLADYKGSPVVLRFFLTDCKFCRADTPVFNEYYARFGSKGLRMVYIDTLNINKDVLKDFREELGVEFPMVRDTGGAIAKSYMVKALPQTIILDPQHKIISAILGGVSEPELRGILSPYLPTE